MCISVCARVPLCIHICNEYVLLFVCVYIYKLQSGIYVFYVQWYDDMCISNLMYIHMNLHVHVY